MIDDGADLELVAKEMCELSKGMDRRRNSDADDSEQVREKLREGEQER